MIRSSHRSYVHSPSIGRLLLKFIKNGILFPKPQGRICLEENMSEVKVFTLEDPEVQAAKARWESFNASSKRKTKLSFEEIFEYFQSESVRQKRIAELAGVTYQAIQQIRKRFFLGIVRSAQEKKTAHTLSCVPAKVLKAKEKLAKENTFQAKIIHKALRLKCDIKPVLQGNNPKHIRLFRNIWIINGYTCKFSCITNSMQANKRDNTKYHHVMVSATRLLSIDMLIIYINHDNKEKMFVIPSKVILNNNCQTTGLVSIYIPIKKSENCNNKKPRVNWLQYQDAWEYLFPPKPTPAT